MYDIRHFMIDYTASEIAEGTYLYLSRQAENYHQKRSRGERSLSACFMEDSHPRDRLVSSMVKLHEDSGELISSECECKQHQKDGFGCCHTAALLAGYLYEKYGKEAFEKSKIRSWLQQKSGVEDPFVPGVLRPTDQILSKLMKKTAVRGTSGQSASEGRMKVEVTLNRIAGGVALELRAGLERLYVVKDLMELLMAYRRGSRFTLGKNEFYLERGNFEPTSAKVLDFLDELMKIEEGRYEAVHGYRSVSLGSELFLNHRRQILISGKNLDELMDMARKIPMIIGGGRGLLYQDREKPLSLQVKKEQYGATISMEQAIMLAESTKKMYFYDKKGIFSLAKADDSIDGEFVKLLLQKKELYVQDRDLTQLSTQYLLPARGQMGLVLEGLDLDEYLPETPAFHFYLDQEQDDLLTLKVYAVYEAGRVLLGSGSGEMEDRLSVDQGQTVLDDVHEIGNASTGQNMSCRRNDAAEQGILNHVQQYFPLPQLEPDGSRSGILCLQAEEEKIYHVITQIIPILRTLGEVYVSDKIKKYKVRSLSQVSVGVKIESGMLELSVMSEQFSDQELVQILSAYSRKKKFTRLKNGDFVSFDNTEQSMEALAEEFRTYGKKDPEKIRMPLYRALYLDQRLNECDDKILQYRGEHSYRMLLNRMDAAVDQEFAIPKSIEPLLRPYQADGYRWMKTLNQYGFGGILADDMGLGKTLQVLTFLLSLKEEGKTLAERRTLIVTPASLLYNWQREIERFTPELSVSIISGQQAERQALISDANEADVWITSYDMLRRDIEQYENISFANEIIDEAQYIKNQTTQSAKAVKLIQSSFRMALTGTPVENHLGELWSIFDYLMPGFLYQYARFRRELELPIIGNQDEEALERLKQMIQPFVLRRMKKDVLTELPDKMEETVIVRLDEKQRELYDAYEQRLKMFLEKQDEKEFAQGKLEILAELTKLRQICCGPEILFEKYKGQNSKMETCIELITRAIAGGHKLLLFSQFTSILDEIGKRLKQEHIEFYRIDGSTKKEKRMKMVEAFASDSIPVFLISLKAGGTGLNLTAADIVIHYDPWWNIAAQNQATDRTHRIGQMNKVTVYSLIAEKTIEERIQKLQEKKAQIASQVLAGEQLQSIKIDKEELLELLE